jgi:formimidoylglutamate deiminase
MLPTIKGNYAVVPGLVNAHSHAFQRVIRGRTEHRTLAAKDSFWTWRETMYRAANRLTPVDVYDVARMSYMEMLLAGITTVGEFHYLHHAPDGSRYDDPNLIAHQLIRAAKDVGIRIVLLQTAYERAGWGKATNPLQSRFLFRSVDSFLRDTDALVATGAQVGIALHSVRALELRSLVRIAEYARSRNLPIHMHLAEQPAEIEECLAEHGRRPVELLHEHGILGGDFTAVHAIHVTGQEVAYLGAAHATVCACPTTERNLGDGAVPADLLLEAGAGICFGSDSNVQINLLEDARCLEYHLRMKKLSRAILPAEALYQAATDSGTRVLGCTRDPGDYFTADLNHPSLAGLEGSDLVTQVIFATQMPAIRDVFVDGKRVIADGHHPDQNAIISAFERLQKRLWE